jgi:cytochrome c oxidase assembly protein subunit 15
MKLFPAIVSLHLLGGMVLLMLLQAQVSGYAFQPRRLDQNALTQSTRTLALWGFALGAWVSTNYAVLACTEFPMCQGQWLPELNMQEGFSIWRPLGQLNDGKNISLAGLTAIHVVHRVFAFVVLMALGWLAWRLYLERQSRRAYMIVGLLVWQLSTGLANVVLGWPLLAAVSHIGGAAGLVLVMTALVMRTAPASVPHVAHMQADQRHNQSSAHAVRP